VARSSFREDIITLAARSNVSPDHTLISDWEYLIAITDKRRVAASPVLSPSAAATVCRNGASARASATAGCSPPQLGEQTKQLTRLRRPMDNPGVPKSMPSQEGHVSTQGPPAASVMTCSTHLERVSASPLAAVRW
jgi:hypothetical protein